MTSIPGSGTAPLFRPPPPAGPSGGRERIDDRIEQGVASGSISATDASALTSALDSLDTSLSADAATGTASGTGGTGRASRPDPAAMKAKIDGLIADQVGAGSLTGAQADTLKSLFAGGGNGARGAGGPGGAEGPPPPGASGSASAADPSGMSGGTDASDGNAAASRLLSDFLSQLQSTLGGGSGYGATGAAGAPRAATSLVMDFDA